MKKLLLTLTILLASTQCFADEIKTQALDKLPTIKHGIGLNMADNTWNYLALTEVYTIKKLNENSDITVDIGYVGPNEDSFHSLAGAVSLNLGDLKERNINIPLAQYVDISISAYFAGGRFNLKEMDESETSYGLGITAVKTF